MIPHKKCSCGATYSLKDFFEWWESQGQRTDHIAAGTDEHELDSQHNECIIVDVPYKEYWLPLMDCPHCRSTIAIEVRL